MSEGGLTADSLRGSSPPAGRVATAIDASDILTASASGRTPVREATPLRLADPLPPDPVPDEPPQERTRLRLVSGKIIPGTRYRLRRWLGEGGMGVVYEAEHIDIERRVALKILRFDLSRNPEMTRVFRDEARAVSKTGHPNIVEVYDFGELPDGRLFMCMELLDGADLVPATETTALPVADVIAIFRQLCKGLGAAHRAGVVHRDVKPENILLCSKLGRDGVVKIVDFGISAMLGNRHDPKKIAGTPHYMAPEQIRGKPFDGRLDQYAAACVAYELLTGRPPFPGEVLEQVLLAHCDSPPPSLKDARPDLQIPAALEQVIARCLAKKPDDRFPSMDEVEAALCEAQIAAGLRTAFDDLPLPDVAPERQARLRERMPSPHSVVRRRWLWPLVAALSILVAAGTVAAMALTREPPPVERSHIDRLAEAALVAATRTAYVAPPAGEPDAPTAYAKVLELEAIDDTSAELADLRAAELRQQFAEGLVALGDKYWDVAGARPFAVEYYIWARTFEPDNPRATERSGMTPGAFTRFQEKARTGSWSLGELQALGLVSALAEDDATRREERVIAAHADASQLSVFQHLDLDQGLRGAGIKIPPKKSAEPPVVAPPPIESPPPIVEPLPELGPDEPDVATPPEPGKSAKKSGPKSSRRDPAKAKELADQGVAALKAGRRGDAESLFHQAIFYDNRNAKALMGLSDVYFDTGAKQKAVQFAELAVEAAPVSRTYHLKLGDAYFVVLRYRDAIKHYEEALELGEHSAQSRIDKVKKLIGP